MHPDGATGVVFKTGDLVATLTTDKNGEAEVNNLYLGNYYVKEITPSEGYLLDEEEHDVVCDYEGDLVAEVSRRTTSAEQVIKPVSYTHLDVYKRQNNYCSYRIVFVS